MKIMLLRLVPLLVHGMALHADSDVPVYQNNVLTIPRVDHAGKVGQYQNVQFKLAADGRWDLQRYDNANLAAIERIQIQTLFSFPAQLQAKVSGYFPNECYRLGEIFTRRDGNHFSIAVNQVQLQTLDVCTTAIKPFEVNIPIDVYGLAKGRYEVSVNNITQFFDLQKDNK